MSDQQNYCNTKFVMPPGILKSSQPIGDDPKLCIYMYIYIFIYLFNIYSCPLLIYNKPNKRIYWTSDKSSPSRSHGMSPGILVFTQKMSGKCIFILRNMVYWLVVWNIFLPYIGNVIIPTEGLKPPTSINMLVAGWLGFSFSGQLKTALFCDGVS